MNDLPPSENNDSFSVKHNFSGNYLGEKLNIEWTFTFKDSNEKEMKISNKFTILNPLSIPISDWKLLVKQIPENMSVPFYNTYGWSNIEIVKSSDQGTYYYVFVLRTSTEYSSSDSIFKIPHELFQPYFSQIVSEMEDILMLEKLSRKIRLLALGYSPSLY